MPPRKTSATEAKETKATTVKSAVKTVKAPTESAPRMEVQTLEPPVESKKMSMAQTMPMTQSNPFTVFLIALLVGAAFIMGSLYSKVKMYEANGGPAKAGMGTTADTTAGTGTTVGTQPNQPAAGAGPSITEIAGQLGLDTSAFQSCVTSGKQAAKVAAQLSSGEKAGIQGTPGTIVVGPNGKAQLVPGALPYEGVKQIIDDALAGKKSAQSEDVTSFDPATSNDHIRGSLSAPVKLIEYSDLQCPFCARFHPTMQKISQDYGDKVVWIYRHYPLNSIHPKAQKAAEGSECVFEQGGNDKFWEYVDKVFSSPNFTV